MSSPVFTVFTSVYNGEKTLMRVYQSLLKQTFQDFEWLIIDDGSTDSTVGLVEQLKGESRINIRFYRQENMHKFYTLLKGIELAKGEFFLNADADDEFREDTLQLFYKAYESVPAEKRKNILGVNCLCQNAAGKIVGDTYPRDGMISDHDEMYYKYKVKGEKWGMQRTEVLKQFKFTPDYFNNGYIPEGILWSQVASAGYKIVFINEPLRTYHNDNNRVSISTGGKRNLEKNSFGSMQSLKAELNHQIKYFRHDPLHFIKGTVLYYEAARLQKLNSVKAASALKGISKILFWTLYPFSVFFFISRREDSKHASES